MAKSHGGRKVSAKQREANNSDWNVDADIRELTSLLYAAMGRFQQIRRTLAGALALTPAEFAVLISLHRLQNARIRELGDDVHVAAANITATVKGLENKGWVVKRTDKRDTRALSVELSPSARQRLDKFFALIHPVNEIWFSGSSAREQMMVKEFLGRLVEQFPPAIQAARSLKRKYNASPDRNPGS